MSTEALAARHYSGGTTSGGTTTTSTLSDRDVRNLAKAYLADFQAVDPNITYRDLIRYIYSLNATSYAEAEAGLQAYLASLQQAAAPNQPPTISGSPATSDTVGNSYSFTPTASDPDGDTLNFSVSNLPAWASFNAATGALSGTPAASDAGVYGNIVISVSDGTDSASLAPFSITVDNPVQLGGTIGFAATTASVTEGDVVKVAITRSNSAGSASVMYGTIGKTAVSSTLGGDDYAGFDPIQLDFAEGETSKVVTVQTLDNNVVESSETFTIYLSSPSTGYTLDANSVTTVTILDNDTVQNQAPTISGAPATSVDAGTAYRFTPSASDPDGDTLNFSVSNLPAWASFDSATGTLAGTPANTDAGTYGNIVISVSDGTDSVSLAPFGITVNSIQLGGSIGFAATTASVTEGDVVNVTITRSNGAGSASIMYGTIGKTAVSSTLGGDDYAGFDPIQLDFAEGETSKVVTVQTLDNNVVESSETFTIYLSSPSTGYTLDANSVTTVTILDNDTAQNQAPTISGTPATSVDAGTAYQFTPSASDPDGDTLNFSVSNLPAWASFDSATGTLAGTPANTDAGTYGNIVISVSDGTDSVSLAPFGITVNSVQLGGSIGFAATTASVTEGDVVKVAITRSNGAGSASIMYGTIGKTAVSSTLGGDDYAGFDPIQLDFAEGETSKVVTVQTLDNNVVESSETFTIYLSSPSTGYTLDTNSVITVTILDNDTAQLGSTTLSWTPPATRADGEPLSMSEIDGYRIYMGDSTSNLTPVLDINDNSVTQYTLTGLPVGAHYFSVTTYDTNGVESSYSNIVNKSAL